MAGPVAALLATAGYYARTGQSCGGQSLIAGWIMGVLETAPGLGTTCGRWTEVGTGQRRAHPDVFEVYKVAWRIHVRAAVKLYLQQLRCCAALCCTSYSAMLIQTVWYDMVCDVPSCAVLCSAYMLYMGASHSALV